ncbi:oligoendopeptidase F [Lacticaseibacillus daqingensis]|uniref:oligoendopeptidase F n=1 Tax=Lacticaseibacillus daqingensis TaxID=2486014 RepID=UPI001783AA7C|nr:oligoendopeptidase F [Lacticaseibacillus daqingensis]
MEQLPTRDAVPEALTWDLTKIFATDADWEAAYTAVTAQAEQTSQLAGTLGQSATALVAGLDAVFATSRALENVYVYASMKSDQDTANAQYQGYKAKAQALIAKVSAQIAFLEPEILAIPAATLTDWQQATPALAPYAHTLDKLTKTRAHVLSAQEEALLSAAGDALGASRATFNVLNNAELPFGVVTDDKGNQRQLSNGVYGQLIRSTQRPVRKEAFQTLFKAYTDFKGTFAATLAGETKRHNFSATAHHYPSARAAAMAHNDIPEAVFDTLLAQVNAHLPLLHRYVALRKRLLGLDDLHMYDLYTPLTGEAPLSYTFEEAKAVALEALAPLGDDYLAHVHEIFDNRYIDVVENQGKRSGAYSGGAYDTPPYELLNWQDGLDALFTLVHETGHSVHSWYTRHNQPFVSGDYPIFVAEIASTSNENLLTDYFLKTQPDPKVRAYVLNHYLDGFKGTVFRQTQFAEFEHWIHEQDAAGAPLTADAMATFYGDLNARYYGPDVARDPEIALEWARIPHFYMNYYVYQYATGFAAASTLASRISAQTPGAVDKYIGYLKSGSSKYPIDTMKTAGVDMTQPDYLEAAFAVFEARLDEFEQLIQASEQA